MNTCVPIKTNKRMGEGQGERERGRQRDVWRGRCSPAVGWLWAPWTWHEGASSLLADALCLSLAAMRRKRRRYIFYEQKEEKNCKKIYFSALVNSKQWRHLLQSAKQIQSFRPRDSSNYLFSKCFWKLSTTLHFRQSNYRLQVQG